MRPTVTSEQHSPAVQISAIEKSNTVSFLTAPSSIALFGSVGMRNSENQAALRPILDQLTQRSGQNASQLPAFRLIYFAQ
jgi:hypothetical protein